MLKQPLSLLIFVSTFSVIIASYSKPRVIGGQDAKLGEFPYQISLQTSLFDRPFVHRCGGSILTTTWILTAGHCYHRLPFKYRIVAGIIDLNGTNPERQVINVTKFIVHPEYVSYSDSGAFNDIALVQLQKPLEFNRFIKAIKLPTAGSDPTGHGIATGWGAIVGTGEIIPNTLQTLQIPIFSDSVCLKHYPEYLSEIQVCAGHLTTGVCFGDSGGPLAQNGQVVGIVSYGIVPCASGHPAIFTKVSSFIDFIEEYIDY